jgi:UDP-2,3-diacylglucosamine hydrolase
MHGNRDFLIGGRFTAACRAKLLSDPTLVNLYGTPTLLMHGDTLCTDDVEYQKFRTQVRNPDFQREFLSRPLAARKQEIEKLRAQSEASKKTKAEEIMDAAPSAVEATLRVHNYPRLIHGHTHRPALHQHVVDGRRCERWVLADWYTSGSYLHCDAAGCRVIKLPAPR